MKGIFHNFLYSIIASSLMFLGMFFIRLVFSLIDVYIYSHGYILMYYSLDECFSDLKLSIFWGVGVAIFMCLYTRFGGYR